MIVLIILVAVTTLCWLGGWKYTLRLFNAGSTKKSDDNDKPIVIPKKEKIFLIVGSAVLLEALAAAIALIAVRLDILSFFEGLRAMLVICVLLFTAYIDFKMMIIPNKLTLFLLAASVLTYVVEFILYRGNIMAVGIDALLGCAICFVIFSLGKMISRKGMGMGDVKMASVMGLALGINSALGCMLWAMILASVTGIILLASKKMKPKSKIAMAPFFFAGTVAGHIILTMGGLL